MKAGKPFSFSEPELITKLVVVEIMTSNKLVDILGLAYSTLATFEIETHYVVEASHVANAQKLSISTKVTYPFADSAILHEG